MIEFEAEPETQADADRAGGIDVTGHDRDFTWLADMCLGRLGAQRGVRRGEIAVRRCSGFWFVFNGQVFERLDAERMGVMVRPILHRCSFRVAKGDDMRTVPLNPTTSTISETLAAMASLPGVLSPEEPDQNEDELIVANGRVSLSTGQLGPFSAAVFATRQVKVELPEPSDELAAASAQWAAYLEGLELGAATLNYIRLALGYSITGRGSEKAFFFLHGAPDTSKTTLLRLVMQVLGKTSAGGYAAETDCNDWLDKGQQNQGHTDSLIGVEGARVVFGDETGENARFNEARIKRAVGGFGSTLRMSSKGEKGRDVPIRFAPWFSSNYLPGSQDNGTQERLKLVTFSKVVEEKDPNFQRRFMTGIMSQAILVWLINAAADYLKTGLGVEPPSVILAREAYAVENDWFGTFLRERIGRRTDLWRGCKPMKASVVGMELAKWARDLNIRSSVSPTKLPAMVEKRTGMKSRMLNGCRVFDDLALLFDTDGFPAEGVVELELV